MQVNKKIKLNVLNLVPNIYKDCMSTYKQKAQILDVNIIIHYLDLNDWIIAKF